MQFNWLLFLSVVSAAYSAVIPQSDIPVKVIYEKQETHRVYVRNLDNTEQDKVKQEIAAENIAKPEEIISANSSEVYSYALKNHDEKLPLSSGDISAALRYLHKEPEEITNESGDTSKETEEHSSLKIVVPDEYSVAPVQPQQPSEGDDFFVRVQDIINNGVTRIKEEVKQSQEVVDPEVWISFNDGVADFLEKVKDRNSLRQGSNGIILEQFSSFSSNFFSGLTGKNQEPQDGVPQPTFPQKVLKAFQNGVGQIQTSFNAEFSVKSSSTPPPGPIQGFVQKAQQAFNNFVNPPQKPGDENSNTPLQNIQSSITNALGNVFNRPGGAAGDESSTQGGPFQAIQSAIQNLNPFRSTTAKPNVSSSSNPTPTDPLGGDNPIQSATQQVTGENNPIQATPDNDPYQ